MQLRARLSAAIIFAAILLIPFAAHAQGFHALYTRDGIDVWAVGDQATVQRSFDGGATFNSATLGTGSLRGVAARGFLVLVAGDAGQIWRSTDSGGHWLLTTASGAPILRAIELVDASVGYVVGDAGTILKTTNGGATWIAQISGTGERLNAVRFRDTSTGWAVGANGVVLKTTNGGANWLPVAAGTNKMLRSVDFLGATVWVVGHDATTLRSTDGGAIWTPVNLAIASNSDVTGVWLESATTVLLTGGGGFIRKSTNGGSSWSFFIHPLMGETGDFFFANNLTKGWACSNQNHVVIRTADSGATWSSSNGTTSTSGWLLKQIITSGGVRGSTLALNGQNKNSLYCALGPVVFKSTNRGETWTSISTIPGATTNKTNAFYVSPTDSMLMVAAVGTPDRIVRSTDGGALWTPTFTIDFTEYGVPLELDRDHPSTLLFGPEDGQLWKSVNFGATWTLLSNPGFRSPCDIEIVQGSTNIIWVADGVTSFGNGELFRSTDGGATFLKRYTAPGSEIPMMAGSRLDNRLGIATFWESGGVRRTLDYGATWDPIVPSGATWGTDFAKDDPNVVVYATYNTAVASISYDFSASTPTFTSNTMGGGANYSFYVLDRATVLAEQGTGIYKLVVNYTVPTSNTQSLNLISPNGGEVWGTGQVRDISWTAQNIAVARIEYRRAPGEAWQFVAELEGYAGSYAWTVPQAVTSQAKMRIRDVWDSSPTDSSSTSFSIRSPVDAGEPTAEVSLSQSGPNPFSRSTQLRYRLPEPARVTLDIFDVQGRRVATLVNAPQPAGVYDVPFGPGAATASGGALASLAPGTYFARLQAGDLVRSHKLVLAR